MKCETCNDVVSYRNSCNVSDKRMCVKCAYDSFPAGSPAKKQFELVYGKEVSK